MKIVTSEEEAQTTAGHVVLASDLGWPDRQAYYDGLWKFFNQPQHTQYIGNTTGPDQEVINTAAVHCVRSWGYYEDSLVGLKALFDNLPRIAECPQYWLSPSTYRAVWAATGPSLLDHIADVKEAFNKGYLIACPDASLHHLLKAGIRPHMVFTTERGLETAHLFEMAAKICDDLSGIIVNMGVYTDKSVYEFVRAHNMSPTYHFRKQSEIFYLFPELKDAVSNRNVQWATPHVAAPSWSWLINRGVKEIILYGQDLAYSPSGDTHAPGSHKDDWLPTLDRIDCQSNDGSNIQTNSYWAEWALDLSNLLEHYKDQKIHVVNTASKGLPIRNTFYATTKLGFQQGPPVELLTAPGIGHIDLKEVHKELKKYRPEYLGKKSIAEFYHACAPALFLGFPLTVDKYCRWQMKKYANGGKNDIALLRNLFRQARKDLLELVENSMKGK